MSAEKAAVVVDTNVAVIANGNKTEQANEKCMSVCRGKLSQIQEGSLFLLLDDRGMILKEYEKHLSPSGQPGLGDVFFKWLWQNRYNDEYCRQISITPHDRREFEEFPDDPDLMCFDMDDRKFVAVALASGSDPRVLNASDTDWWDYYEQLRKHGVKVVFLCPELMPAER